jgi:predicted amidohydrolase YtcJ
MFGNQSLKHTAIDIFPVIGKLRTVNQIYSIGSLGNETFTDHSYIMAKQDSAQPAPSVIGEFTAYTQQLKRNLGNLTMPALDKNPDTRPFIKINICWQINLINRQGLHLAGVNTGAAQGAVITDNSAAINNLDGIKWTAFLAKPAADT